MIDWTVPANGWESVVSAVVQVGIVLLAALFTWAITRSSERRRAREERGAEYRRQIDSYYEDLQDFGDQLEEAAQREGALGEDGWKIINRWLSRVSWMPHQEHRVIDAWVRTQMLRIPARFTYLTETKNWDDEAVQSLREDVRRTISQFAAWLDGKVAPSWFLEDYNAGGMQFWMGRLGRPNENAPSRAARLRTAFAEAAEGFRRAWRRPE